jgi:hypothetical protein
MDFRVGLKVLFGGAEVPAAFDPAADPARITIHVPAGFPAGPAPVKVLNPGPEASNVLEFLVLQTFIRGDANLDGILNISDAIASCHALYLGGILSCADALDVNDDGVMELTDVIRLLEFLFQGGPPPEAPFPGKGADTTLDGLDCKRY